MAAIAYVSVQHLSLFSFRLQCLRRVRVFIVRRLPRGQKGFSNRGFRKGDRRSARELLSPLNPHGHNGNILVYHVFSNRVSLSRDTPVVDQKKESHNVCSPRGKWEWKEKNNLTGNGANGFLTTAPRRMRQTRKVRPSNGVTFSQKFRADGENSIILTFRRKAWLTRHVHVQSVFKSDIARRESLKDVRRAPGKGGTGQAEKGQNFIFCLHCLFRRKLGPILKSNTSLGRQNTRMQI